MHKDKGNGIVMMPKFAVRGHSFYRIAFLSPKCFFSISNCCPHELRRRIYSVFPRQFVSRFDLFPVIDLRFQLALIYGRSLLSLFLLVVQFHSPRDCFLYSPVDWFGFSSAYDSSSELYFHFAGLFFDNFYGFFFFFLQLKLIQFFPFFTFPRFPQNSVRRKLSFNLILRSEMHKKTAFRSQIVFTSPKILFNNPFRTCLNHAAIWWGRRNVKHKKNIHTTLRDLSRWIKWND